jgi:hypothetical protein
LRFAADAFSRLGAGDRWAYFDAHTGGWLGPAAGSILERAGSADLLLNLSAVNPLRPWLLDIPVRAYVDTDPAFTQVRHLTDLAAQRLAAGHTAFFTFAENVSDGTARLPDDGFAWRATRQPVLLDRWSAPPGPADGRFTTVMQWDSYASREYQGVRYGMKSDSFGPYLDLVTRTGQPLELALGSASAPRDELTRLGWNLRDPFEVTRDPWVYRRYIERSKAEFSVAKEGYVVANTGWFSERSANYLASGRPVATQDTGFSSWLGTGEGVVAFETPDDAVHAIDDVSARYATHCRAAREIAQEFFDAGKVLPRLIEDAMGDHASQSRAVSDRA